MPVYLEDADRKQVDSGKKAGIMSWSKRGSKISQEDITSFKEYKI